MIISNAHKDDKGDWKFDLGLVEQEVDFLVNLSVMSLLKAGIVSVQEQEEPQEINLTEEFKNSSSLKVH